MATPSAPATALLPHVDELVLEYLLFRGFTRSFQALAAERKRDRAKGFDVEQITAQLLAFVQNYQLEPMLDTWKFLDARFFSRLDASYTATIRQLEDSWLRLYLVHAIKNGHRDKATEFFRILVYADKLNAKASASSGDSWHRWFILPYVQHPENDLFFRPFFEKQWPETFVTSFRNFLSLIFRNMSLPKLLALQVGRLEEPALKLRLKTSQSECKRLRLQNAKSAEQIHRLEDAGHKMLHMVETLVQHSFAEHFIDSDAGGWSEKIPEDGDVAPEMLKALNTLSTQLRELRDALGPPSRDDARHPDTALVEALLNPLAVKLNAVTSTRGGMPDVPDGATTIVGLASSPSSSSLQSAESVGSPAHSSSTMLRPVLVDEVPLTFDSSKDCSGGICKYAHDGRRLVVARIGERTIQVLDVDADGVAAVREQIHTEASVRGVDWVAHSECLVYALEDGTINVWNTDTKTRTFIISYNADERRPLRLACARSKSVGAVALVANAGDFTRASSMTRVQFFAFEDQAIRVLSSVDLDGTADLQSLCWASDGSTLAVTDSDGCVSFLSTSEETPLGSWQLGTRDHPISAVSFGPDDQTLFVVGVSARVVMEWSVPDLVAAGSSDPPPQRAVYRLPAEMADADGVLTRLIEIQATRSRFAVSSSSSSSKALWTVYMRDHPEAVIAAPVTISGPIEGLAWHPLDNMVAVTTAAGKLHVWKLLE